MSFNVHPFIVHFPVALLTLYVLLEFFRLKILTKQTYYFYLKSLLLIFGTAGAGFAILSGKLAEENIGEDVNYLVHTHELWAFLTFGLFAICTLSYFIIWVERDFNSQFVIKLKNFVLWQFFTKFARAFLESPLIVILAFLGFVALSITGALGGSIVYGGNSDPFSQLIYNIFFGTQ